ncbi:hypothetical protein SMACR_09632 [Sordaria macrospora]|uniref:WGS project CABT00000000 data, contig 2.111 n=2 Tax=Sordaria macrospora TaxID=5147 RepID=F7WCC0_SORMK|nr:uncharacterized protein SMAC_09632 [Sordaria macrospora k-hell]KAA8630559.1 hypothetical protein SMACR_09632 [Sordaria macrospora]WPJ62526.1 hypothetical protein SMAC4_09632 [Sordaria macrospora]CCC05590.1 unnamed protein product [Sordaria macrospora k-hell]
MRTFASHGYPFDDQGPVYVGEDRLTDRESVSLKHGFYLLANVADKFVDQYPMLQKLIQHGSEAFRQKLRTGLLELLRKVKASIYSNMRDHWKIERLQVRVPAEWNHEFRIPFRALLAEVFEWNENKAFEITSFTMGADSDALGLLNRNNPYTSGTKPRQLWLFIHYGGHSLKRSSGPPRFHRRQERIGDGYGKAFESVGAGGGTENLFHHFLAAFKAKYLDPPAGSEGPARPMTPCISEQLRQQFDNNAVREMWGPPLYAYEEYRFTFRVRLVENGEVIRCPFSQDEVSQIWNDAHKHAFELVEKLLQELKDWTTRPFNGALHEPVICIAGGSAKNLLFRRKVSAMIRKAELPMAVFPPTYNV